MIKILHILSSLDTGGVEKLLLEYYKLMDSAEYQFDFIVHDAKVGKLEQYFMSKNSNIYHITNKHQSILRNLYEMRKIISTGNYDVVHAHQDFMSVFPMYFAYNSKIKIRIAHSHQSRKNIGFLRYVTNSLFRYFLKKYSTTWCACGLEAGKYLWGSESINDPQFSILHNAIDIEKFSFDLKIRNNMRKELEIENKFVIGNIGRFADIKNHIFLIKIFKQIYIKNRNSVLILIGKGELEDSIKNLVSEFELDSVVQFLGAKEDVSSLYQAMDIFLLPSKGEGLGIVFIEAQAAGLVCFASDVVVPRDTEITDLINYVNLDKSPEFWAQEVLKYKNGYIRRNTLREIKTNGYDIREEVEKLSDLYKWQNK